MANSTEHWKKPKVPKNRLYFHLNKTEFIIGMILDYGLEPRSGEPILGNWDYMYMYLQKNRILTGLDDLISNMIVTVIASIHLSKGTAW